MTIRIHEQLYRDGISDIKLSIYKKKIKRKSPKLDLFLVTLPLGKDGILEVYWYPELLQDYYQNMKTEVLVVGLASGREEAFGIIEQIIKDVGCVDGNIPIREYFKVSR
ncbi:MAG: hypothetical protein IJP29_07505 [Lachnospiraceae bacterium]|nr:hypothetical protein [Lachnospiraceae bacterium]